MKNSFIFGAVGLAVIVLAGSLWFVYVAFGINPPSSNPPTGVGIINVSSSSVTDTIYVSSTGNVGIGTLTPSYKLDVVSGGSSTARLGSSGIDQVTIGGGTGKLNVGTIDPVYEVNGEKYATYVPGMIGQREEIAGILTLQPTTNNRQPFQYTIDFDNQEQGSDLWLFRKIVDFGGKDWQFLSVLVSPKFSGRVWYEKIPAENQLVIYAIPNDSQLAIRDLPTLEVSYRLSAPRFDWRSWGNLNHDQSLTGFKIK